MIWRDFNIQIRNYISFLYIWTNFSYQITIIIHTHSNQYVPFFQGGHEKIKKLTRPMELRQENQKKTDYLKYQHDQMTCMILLRNY